MAKKRKDEVFATVTGGHLNPKARKLIERILQEHENKRILITIERKYNKRSDLQNAYYWGCIVQHQIEAFEDLWGELYNKDQIHSFNKTTFFGIEQVFPDTGVIVRIPGTTTTLSTVEFGEAIDEIRKYFLENFGHIIPEPGEQIDIFEQNKQLDKKYRYTEENE